MHFHSRHVRTALLAAACCALAVTATAQKLFKHVDDKGVVTYSDRPDTVGEKKITVDNTKRNGDRSAAINSNMQQTPADPKAKAATNRRNTKLARD